MVGVDSLECWIGYLKVTDVMQELLTIIAAIQHSLKFKLYQYYKNIKYLMYFKTKIQTVYGNQCKDRELLLPGKVIKNVAISSRLPKIF